MRRDESRNEPRMGPLWRTVVLLAAALLVGSGAAGCASLWRTIFGWPDQKFPHRTHMDFELGFFLECSDCHVPAQDGERYTVEGHEVCGECHQDGVKGEPHPKCLFCHDEEAPPPTTPQHYLGEERTFSHAVHGEIDCARCHEERGPGGLAMSIQMMPDCIGCHESRGATIDCDGCHKTIRKDLPPPSHDGFFLRNHGRVGGATHAYCSFCHEEDECSQCHDIMRPASHTLRWKDMAHGIAAVRDRDPCAVCHDADSCDGCHSERPQTHYRPQWNVGAGHRDQARLNLRACYACHDFDDLCVNCHMGRNDIRIRRD